ncbi:MAG TPA: hypothetical protein VHH35_19475, partial [Pyrinomonadaceae bacterium]|nr:hypothetical protein [Pyrinomonadaceae bacterium]
MNKQKRVKVLLVAILVLSTAAILIVTDAARAQQQQRPSSFTPVIEEPFEVVRARDKAKKASVAAA